MADGDGRYCEEKGTSQERSFGDFCSAFGQITSALCSSVKCLHEATASSQREPIRKNATIILRLNMAEFGSM